jgi:hypothetical protein
LGGAQDLEGVAGLVEPAEDTLAQRGDGEGDRRGNRDGGEDDQRGGGHAADWSVLRESPRSTSEMKKTSTNNVTWTTISDTESITPAESADAGGTPKRWN